MNKIINKFWRIVQNLLLIERKFKAFKIDLKKIKKKAKDKKAHEQS